MADVPPLPSSDQEMAAALDEALDALQRGRAVDRAALVARHPDARPGLTPPGTGPGREARSDDRAGTHRPTTRVRTDQTLEQ